MWGFFFEVDNPKVLDYIFHIIYYLCQKLMF